MTYPITALSNLPFLSKDFRKGGYKSNSAPLYKPIALWKTAFETVLGNSFLPKLPYSLLFFLPLCDEGNWRSVTWTTLKTI